jgi:hypothetical protein
MQKKQFSQNYSLKTRAYIQNSGTWAGYGWATIPNPLNMFSRAYTGTGSQSIVYMNTNSYTDGQAAWRDTYHNLEILRNGNTSTIFKKDNSTIWTDSTHLISDNMGMHIYPFDMSIYADWIFIRKYTSIEPTYSFGSQN